jgi:DNA-binding transcriptional MerR regulator
MQPRELVKLYYRIGEVAEIVGVQPHVLRYWETEFRSIRPQKSTKGQRVYSRRDVEKLLRVKDLLRNQGFTIAGARKKLHDPADEVRVERAPAAPERAAHPAHASASTRGVLQAIRQDLLRMIAELDARKNA